MDYRAQHSCGESGKMLLSGLRVVKRQQKRDRPKFREENDQLSNLESRSEEIEGSRVTSANH